MTDSHINMRAHDVRALLEGRKTQHRTVISTARVFATPERPAFTLRGNDLARAMQNADRFRHIEGDGWFWEADAFEWQAPHTRTGWMAHLGYAPGDRLWVCESLHADSNDQGVEWMAYAADNKAVWPTTLWVKSRKVIPSIHMPRWASRLTLIVESVKVERLQDISEVDAIAEGVTEDLCADIAGAAGAQAAWAAHMAMDGFDPARGFEMLWNTINGPGAWEANPWVVAPTFRVVKGNIDQIGGAA